MIWQWWLHVTRRFHAKHVHKCMSPKLWCTDLAARCEAEAVLYTARKHAQDQEYYSAMQCHVCSDCLPVVLLLASM